MERSDVNYGDPVESGTDSTGSLSSMARKVGISPDMISSIRDKMKGFDLGKTREYARANPGKTLGILSALVIGAGLLARRHR